MAERRYTPRPVPQQLSAPARAFLEEELRRIAYTVNRILDAVEALQSEAKQKEQ